MLDQRGQRLRAAPGFAALPRPSYDRALWALRAWLGSWAGIGRIAVRMARQSCDLQLARYDERGWRATFYTPGMEHSITSATVPMRLIGLAIILALGLTVAPLTSGATSSKPPRIAWLGTASRSDPRVPPNIQASTLRAIRRGSSYDLFTIPSRP